MTVCDVCGGDDYYEDDGHFFCNVCNTQSQTMAVLEQDDSYRLSQIPSGTLQEIRVRSGKKKACSEYEAGRPWTRYEAYQLILQGQADALIAHGAHPSVKKAVLQLYFAYLSKLEVAFVGEKNTCLIPRALQDAEFTGWHRELHRGGMENPEIKVKARQRKLAKTLRACRANRRKKKQVDEGDIPIEEDDDDDDDDKESVLDLPLPVDPEDGSEAEDVPKTACNSKHSTSKPRMGKQVVLLNIQYMNLRRTLAFLYTACLFASPWITVSDIVRWVRDGSLPYLETSHLLHLDMKMSCYDQHLFKPSSVSSEGLRQEAGSLLRLLKVVQLPEFLMEDITIKYTLALHLPEALVPCVLSVVKKCPVKCSSRLSEDHLKTVPNVDALCAAYILVALKAIFGLDDDSEWLLSEYTKEVQEKVDVQLFNWQEWQWHASRRLLAGTDKVPAALDGQQGGGEKDSVEALCQAFENAQYKDQNYSHKKLYHQRKMMKVASFKQENREMLKRPVSILEDCWKNRDATAARIRAAHGHPTPQETETVEFHSRALGHLLQPELFLHTHLAEGSTPGTSPANRQASVRSTAESPVSQASATSPDSGRDCLLSASNSGSDSLVTGRRKDETGDRKRKRTWEDRESGKKRSSAGRMSQNKKDFEDGESGSDETDRVKRMKKNSADRKSRNKHLEDSESSSDEAERVKRKKSRSADRKSQTNKHFEDSESSSDEAQREKRKKRNSADRKSQNTKRFEDSESSSGEAERVKRIQENHHPGDTFSRLLEMRAKVSEDYWVCPQQTRAGAYSLSDDKPWWRQQSRSYRWLMQVLSSLVHCSFTDIQRMVYEVECGLIKLTRRKSP